MPQTFTPPDSSDLNLEPWWREALDAYFDPAQICYLTDSIYAVLTNDLHSTFKRCDREARASLPSILTYMERMENRKAWGSPHIVKAWLNQPGKRGSS